MGTGALTRKCFFRLFAALLLIVCPIMSHAGENKSPTGSTSILALGDSLTAGFLLPARYSFTSQLEHWLNHLGYQARVINAGVNGDTIYGGFMRLPDLLKNKPDAVIVELGTNDIILKRDTKLMRKDLAAILDRLKKEGIPVLLAGTHAMPGQGDKYDQQVKDMYKELAEQYGAVFHPFFLGEVHGDPGLTFPDGVHPNKDGVTLIVQNILPKVKELLARVEKK